MFQQMRLYRFKFLAVQMDQSAAFFAFAVKTGLSAFMGMLPDIFKAGRRVCVDDVFADEALVNHAFKLAVYCGLSDRISLTVEVFADIRDIDMHARHFLQVFLKYLSLFCSVFRSDGGAHD